MTFPRGNVVRVAKSLRNEEKADWTKEKIGNHKLLNPPSPPFRKSVRG